MKKPHGRSTLLKKIEDVPVDTIATQNILFVLEVEHIKMIRQDMSVTGIEEKQAEMAIKIPVEISTALPDFGQTLSLLDR